MDNFLAYTQLRVARNRVYANTSGVVTAYTQLRVVLVTAYTQLRGPSHGPRTLSRTLGLMSGPSEDLGQAIPGSRAREWEPS